MALNEAELEIVKLENLLDKNLVLPSYQRPYSWSVKSANTLFMDTYNAYKNNIDEYRLGTVILHESNVSYNIVDGQQRLTTLSILLYCLSYDAQMLQNAEYGELSKNAIVTNFIILSARVNELEDIERKKYKEYLLHKCSIVQIITDSEQEAFQFFDSQNSRGKELAPHDLLKSYHLREMNSETEDEKIKIITQWENSNSNDLAVLFKNYLYPLIQWYKGRDGLDYSAQKISAFKGIQKTNLYNFSTYHKASHLYVEQFNISGNNELLGIKYLNQFQLTQPLIAGKRFFNYTHHYETLLEQIQTKTSDFVAQDLIPNKRSGDIYIKQLYEAVLLFFTDRFGIESLTQPVMQFFYSWCYSLRIVMYAVYPQTINKYALGQHERINEELDIFTVISEMTDPEELKLIILAQPPVGEINQKYNKIFELICEWNGWTKGAK